MNDYLYEELRKITPEEQRILGGSKDIEKELYMSDTGKDAYEVDAGKLLDDGKLIQVRTHTRFVHFPKHTHNYIEVIYMYHGSTHHIINGEDVILNKGELLFLNQNMVQEIYPAGMDDIAVNFIILPEFFEYALGMLEDENLLHTFIMESLRGDHVDFGYMHFHVADILPIQNLTENLIWTIHNHLPNKRSMNQITMGLLFLQLANHIDCLHTGTIRQTEKMVIEVLSYIEEHYKDGTLEELAGQLHFDLYWLSKEIKKKTGKTYTELVQEKRLNQAAYLLSHTGMTVVDVANAVGYENISYFHRIFNSKYYMTPRKYRLGKGNTSTK
ncbi:MAG: AraC family transcriptional regulator [Lachnospira sp.]|nr:AraC family transcriptional regulator [Lachnospira sp.]